MIPSNSEECEAEFKLQAGEQIPFCQLLFHVNQDRTLSPNNLKEDVWIIKESRDTASPTGTQLPVVPVDNWTNHRCPAAHLDGFQLQDPSISDQGRDNSF